MITKSKLHRMGFWKAVNYVWGCWFRYEIGDYERKQWVKWIALNVGL